MTKPIERVYVIENNLDGPQQASSFDVNPERAERFAKAIGGHVRVFEEKPRWITASVPPSDSRPVLAMYAAHDKGPMVRLIVAIFGSESKWVALDHDLRRQYLDEGTVVRWCELPVLEEY